ncbi:ABC-type nitrate/sulfonate/bicarbonate transport system substrate-binding protein [Bradyrhizobium sp. JR18.2]
MMNAILGLLPATRARLGLATRKGLRACWPAPVALGLTAPAFAEPPLEKTEIRYQGSARQVTFIELAEDLGYLAPLKLKWVGNTISGPHDIQTVVTGDIDIGGAFYGAILKLIAAKAPVKAVVGYYGSDANTYYGYFVKEDSPIKTAHDLIGKKVAVNTLGAHLEFVLREYLARSGLSAGEARKVTLVAVPPVSGEQALRQGQVEVSALGGVLRDKALERGGIRSLFVDTGLFGQFTGGAYVLREKFIKDNPNASRKLVEGISRAIEWAQITPPEEVQARFDKIVAERERNEDASDQILEEHRRCVQGRRDLGQRNPGMDRLAGEGRPVQAGSGQGFRHLHQCVQLFPSRKEGGGPMTSVKIRFEHVRKEFVVRGEGCGPGRHFIALEDITLDVRSGEFFALVGPSGCGKSTLLDLLGGLTRPDPARWPADCRTRSRPRHRVPAVCAVSLAHRRPECRVRA